MTLIDLNRAWQELRTAALGRSGFELHVSQELASRFTRELAGWDRWYAQAGFNEELFGSTHPEVLGWLKRYRDLAYDMKREGLRVSELVPTAGEQISEAGADVGKGLLALAAAGLVAWIWLNRRRRS